MRTTRRVAGHRARAGSTTPDEAPPRTSLLPALGPQLAGFAIAVLVLIPAGAEVFLAGGSMAKAVAIAKVLPPTQLGLELLPPAAAIAVGLLLALFYMHARWAFRYPAGYREAKETTRDLTALPLLTPFFLGVALQGSWVSGVLSLVGLGMILGLMTFLVLVHPTPVATGALGLVITSCLVGFMALAPTIIPVVLLPGESGGFPLLDVTVDGVWVVDDDHRAAFVPLDTSEIVVCEPGDECDALRPAPSGSPTATPAP